MAFNFNVDLQTFSIDTVGPMGTSASTLVTENVIATAISTATDYSKVLVQRDFNAVGDGVADDTTAVNNAIAGAISAGKVLFFESGTYLISGGLTASAAIEIQADRGVSITAATQTFTMLTVSAGPFKMTGMDFNATVLTSGDAISFSASALVTIKTCSFNTFDGIAVTGNLLTGTSLADLSFTGQNADCIAVTGDIVGASIINCKSDDTTINLVNCTGMNDVEITGCDGGDIVKATGTNGFLGVWIAGNRLADISFTASGATNEELFIHNNVANTIVLDVDGETANRVTITANQVASTGNGINFQAATAGNLASAAISGNTIIGPGATNTGILFGANVVCTGVRVANNIVRSYSVGIDWQGTITDCDVFSNYSNATTNYALAAGFIGTGVMTFDLSDPRGYTFSNIGFDNINVKRDFNAVGDGVTDDTANLNLALAAGVSQGKPVFFPDGTYRTTGILTVPASLTGFRMYGASIQGTSIFADYVGNTLNFVGGNGIIVQNMSFNPQTALEGGVAITVNPVTAGTVPSNDITIKNVQTGANAALGAVELIYVTNATISDCVFKAGDIQISGSTAKSNDVTIRNTECPNIVLDSLLSNCTITDCQILSSAADGIECRNDGSTITDLNIHNCNIDGSTTDGISLGNVDGVRISGCVIANGSTLGIDFLTGGTQVNVIIADNYFHDNASGGITVRNTGTIVISDNIFLDNSTPVNTNSAIIADSTRTSGALNVTSNRISGTHIYALDFDAGVTNFTVTGNTVAGTTSTVNPAWPGSAATRVITGNNIS